MCCRFTGWVGVGGGARWWRIGRAGVSGDGKSLLLFSNCGSCGVNDPQFGTDSGFYVFKLPFLTFLTSWFFAALLIVLIVTAVAHYLNGGIRVSSPRQRVTPQVKAHLSVLLGLLALVQPAGYWLQRYDLTVPSPGYVPAPGPPNIHSHTPALN